MCETPMVGYVLDNDDDGTALFARVCPTCCRFVKPDESVWTNEERGPSPEPNATCSKCGRVCMPFQGYI